MADDKEVFQAVITAKDETTKTMEDVRGRFKHLAADAHHVGSEIERMHKPHIFAELNEHIDLTREHFGELHASVGEIGSSLTELLPALGALSLAGGLAGLFETAEHVSESFAVMGHTAKELGFTTKYLHDLQGAAVLTDTNVDGLARAMDHLNKVLAATTGGRDKDTATNFRRLKISLYDANHQARNAGDILPELADAFQRTGAATSRANAAFILFGKTGKDLIPMLSDGGEKLKDAMKEGAELSFDFTPYADELDHYNESMKKLGLASVSFTDELGSKLAPVLQPAVDMATKWVKANEDWITTGITTEVGKFVHYLEDVNWKKIGNDIEGWGHDVHVFVDALGGIGPVLKGIEALVALNVLSGLFFKPMKELLAFSGALVGLGVKVKSLAAEWRGVEGAEGRGGGARGSGGRRARRRCSRRAGGRG